MKILFLDFDGVLNSERYLRNSQSFGPQLEEAKMGLLKKIINATNAKIVLSTSWREHWDKSSDQCDSTGKEINCIFNRFGLEIFDKTPFLSLNREREIERWLNENPNASNFVLLDDRFLDSEILRGHLVKTSNYIGLNEKAVKEAIDILNC